MTWKEDDNWKIVFPDRKIFIMKHHNWAFVAWDIARDKGWIRDNSTLFHVDQHLDAAIDGAMVPGVLNKKGLKELSKITQSLYGNKSYVGTDNFIWAGFARKTIQNVIYVSPENPIDDLFDIDSHSHHLKDHLSQKRIEQFAGYHWRSMETFEYSQEKKINDIFTNGNTLILDLDLDFFAYESKTDTEHTCYKLKDKEEIQRDLRVLKDMYVWDAITIALSPEDYHIGGPNNAEFVLNLFLEEFQVDLSQGKDWSTLELK
ncbi:UPF0489 family protein [Peribacillus sp. R9-11]|uniref:UPF0489 family protein n=1 Tax=Peribacillus sp. R9-11 TaxID=3073271 RepID=UPI002868BD3E|nr:UPF0489 family protein [Peribacillus sp. R9-11]WMX57462.1 UPF0489 family protein [Peribacillus sp. R9-11]